MKNIIIITSLIFSMLFALGIATATNQFVTNNQTNECAIFNPGDNYTQYTLPENWTIVDPIPDNMTLACETLNYTYLGELINLTKTCISNCTNDTVLNDTTCMCDAVIANETNVTTFYCYGVGAMMIPIPNATCNQYNSTDGNPLLGASCSEILVECQEQLDNATLVNETVNETINETVNQTIPQSNQTTNQTPTGNQTIVPSININERFSDPYTLLALGIMISLVFVAVYLYRRKKATHAADFAFPPRL